MPRSKYSGNDCRTLSNFSGYSAASTARPTPVASTPAGYLFFINKIAADPIAPRTSAFFQLSITVPQKQFALSAIVPQPAAHQKPQLSPPSCPCILRPSLGGLMFPLHTRRTAFILILALG